MGLEETLRAAHEALERAGIDHALIGALAMAVHGYGRATFDVDLLLDGDRRDAGRAALIAAGFTPFFESEEVIQLTGKGVALDCLLARRAPSRSMLAGALAGPLGIKCVRAEDLVGLKIQAYVNDRARELREKADIQALMRCKPDLDWAAVRRYAEIFDEWRAIDLLRPS